MRLLLVMKDGNRGIKFSQHASTNVESEVIEGEGSGNVPVSQGYMVMVMVTMVINQNKEEISTTDLMIKKTVKDLMILIYIYAEV